MVRAVIGLAGVRVRGPVWLGHSRLAEVGRGLSLFPQGGQAGE